MGFLGQRMALVNDDGTVRNIIVYDPSLPEERQFKCPDGCQLIPVGDKPVSPGDTWDGEKFIPAPQEQPEPDPDYQGFLLAAYEQLGHARAREILREYPELSIAASRENAAVMRGAFDQALTDEFIAQSEYDLLVGLMGEYHIPQ